MRSISLLKIAIRPLSPFFFLPFVLSLLFFFLFAGSSPASGPIDDQTQQVPLHIRGKTGTAPVQPTGVAYSGEQRLLSHS